MAGLRPEAFIKYSVLGPVLLATCLLAAQNGSSPSNGSSVPTYKATAETVLVDVVVTDGKGKPVSNLTRDDFALSENGQPQQIKFFEEHGNGTTPETVVSSTGTVPGVYTNAASVESYDAQDVLLLDALNTPAIDQARVRQQMVKYLHGIPRGTRIAVFTLGTELRMVQSFATDSSTLLAALGQNDKRFRPEGSSLLESFQQREDRLRVQDDLQQEASPSRDKPEGEVAMAEAALERFQQSQANYAAATTDLRVRTTLVAFQQIGRFLAGVPGRKNLIWLSGSFPLALFPDPDLKDPYEALRSYSKEIQMTDALLSSARVAVYPVDARGLFPQAMYSAAASGGNMARTPDLAAKEEWKSFQQNAAENMTLDTMANETGGEAIYNTNDISGALDEVHKRGGHFYTLAYTPGKHARDGDYRRINLKMVHAKYHLEYRRGYVAQREEKPEQNQLQQQLISQMTPGVPNATEILFHVKAAVESQPVSEPIKGDNPKIKKPASRYNFDYAVDPRSLRLDQDADGALHGLLTILTIAYDTSGQPLNSNIANLKINVPANAVSRFQQVGIHFQQELDIPSDGASIRSGMLENETGQIGTLDIKLPLPN
jgi:VWFA-related protein